MSPFLIGFFSFFNSSAIQFFKLSVLSKPFLPPVLCLPPSSVSVSFIQGFGIQVWRSKELVESWWVGGGGERVWSVDVQGRRGTWRECVYVYRIYDIPIARKLSFCLYSSGVLSPQECKQISSVALVSPQAHTMLAILYAWPRTS